MSGVKSTGKPITLGIALANLPERGIATDVQEYLDTKGAASIKPVALPGRGGITAAAFDYWGVLSKASDILQVGGALWFIYERFIAPKKPAASDAGVYIVVPSNVRGTEFWLGKTHKSRAEFLRDFEAAMLPLLQGKQPSRMKGRTKKSRKRGPRDR